MNERRDRWMDEQIIFEYVEGNGKRWRGHDEPQLSSDVACGTGSFTWSGGARNIAWGSNSGEKKSKLEGDGTPDAEARVAEEEDGGAAALLDGPSPPTVLPPPLLLLLLLLAISRSFAAPLSPPHLHCRCFRPLT
eukprot:GHVU01173762.1.p2 GENE.GHVU01173762.1~~GHVU01173762.1.p2  ORF type:complete len:135 (+),score=20.83 GHVU01173762.1:552-956(+)